MSERNYLDSDNQENFIYCPRCGQRYNSNLETCPFCGFENHIIKKSEISKKKTSESRVSTLKFIIGLVSFVFFAIFFLQSCSVFMFGSFVSADYTDAGTGGMIGSLCYIVASIIAVIARNKDTKGINISCAVFYWLAFACGCLSRAYYPDAFIWGIFAYAFGLVFLLSAMKTKKEREISILIATIYFILGII